VLYSSPDQCPEQAPVFKRRTLKLLMIILRERRGAAGGKRPFSVSF
jgi:hypothetical protein